MSRCLRNAPIIRWSLLAFACAVVGCLPANGAMDHGADANSFGRMPRAYRDSGGGWVLDGLHVTGRPVDIDIASYRLVVSGNVMHPLSLSYEEIRAMPAVREEVTLVCPGVFVDTGVWTGVPLRDILNKAVPMEGSDRVAFVSADERYDAELPLERALGEGVLIAYEFEGRPFDRRHGFPLRLVARGEPGYSWVKWLGKIEVTGESGTSSTRQ